MGFQEDMVRLTRHFKLLEREYEQWFSGALPTPPWHTQRICQAIVKEYNQNPPRNLSEQSIFGMHQAKFNTYMEMWNRRLRLKEEGKLATGRQERSKRVARPASATNTGDDSYRRVFDTYVAEKQRAGEPAGKITYESFKTALDKQADQLRSTRGLTNVNFGVSVKDGKVSVVARRKKP